MTTKPNVLFITGNGHGLGHLTRQMAVARQARNRFIPIFLTMSQAFPIVREYGWVVEYLPSYTRLGMARGDWDPLFASRLFALLRHTKPRALVIDHISPPPILSSIRAGCQGIEFIWSRRAMWREGLNKGAIRHSGYFDMVVEPGDVASPIDIGLTTEHHDKVTYVRPIVLMEEGEHAERVEARRALGIPLEGRAVLIQVSDDDPEKLSALIAQVRDVVRSAAADEIVHLFAPLHALYRGAASQVSGVIMRPVYPVATHLKAFDGIVSTAGYNSFHETVASGLPAVFIARDTDSLDDQFRRARFAELCGRAFIAQTAFDAEFEKAVERMLSPFEINVAARVTEELGDFEGAGQFADLLEECCKRQDSQPFHDGDGLTHEAPSTQVLRELRSGRSPKEGVESDAETVVIVALGHDQLTFEYLTHEIDAMQERTKSFKPVFLIDDVDTRSLDDCGFLYETIMTPSAYAIVGSANYEAYVEDSIEGVRFRYQPVRLVTLASDRMVDASMVLGKEV